ncbi:MAG: sulfur carrier protein ThiS [Opitutae bacterium]
MKIFVNDQPKELSDGLDLGSLTEELGLLESKGWAFAVNETIVPKAQLRDTILMEGDRILLIQATQGG